MGKSIPPNNNEELFRMIVQMNEKISSAKVLNGGFDKLTKQVDEIKEMQIRLGSDFQAHVANDNRIEAKIDRLYDPEEGIYAKVNKTEMMLESLSENVKTLTEVDSKMAKDIKSIEEKSSTTANKVMNLEKISGEDNKDLVTAIKTSKLLWKFVAGAGTGILTAIGKLLWDIFKM